MRWFRKYLQAWRLYRQAKAIISAAGPGDMARIKAQFILAAIAARQPVCVQCLTPYVPYEHSFEDRFLLRSILKIPDREPDPMICEICFERTISVSNRHATVPGTSNAGPPNLLLRKLN